MFRKNTASQFIHFQGVDSTTGGIKSGVTWTIRRCIDGTFAAATGTVTEDGTAGWYKLAMSQADTNGNDIGFNFTGSGAIPQTVNIVTTACDPTAATNFGITALPAVASGSAGAVLIDGTGTAAISNSAGKVLLQATQSGVTIPTVTTVTNQLTAGQVATGVWQDATGSDFTTASSIGKSLYTSGVVPGGTNGLFIAGTNAATTITTALTTTFTGNLTGSVASVTAGVTLAASAVQAIWDALTSALTTVGSIGKLLVTNIDAAISSRMATYTQPTGFLAATFPGTVASTTNITGGTITTTTNLTNAPTNGDFTAAMKTSLNAATPASVTGAVGSVIGNVGGNVTGSAGSVLAAVAITSNRKKGSGATFTFTMTDSTTGADKTGLTVASVISKDGGAFASTSNSVTEIANGYYSIALTATEMTANNISLQFTATGAVTRDIAIQTQP